MRVRNSLWNLPFETNDRFHMSSHREQIDCVHVTDLEAVFAEALAIACKRRGVAGDVDYALCAEL